MNPEEMQLATRVIHAGRPEPRIEGAAVVPIFQCSVFEHTGETSRYGEVRETLVTRPCTTSHAGLSREERNSLGITDGLIRVSVGIEAVEDLVRDFDAALTG